MKRRGTLFLLLALVLAAAKVSVGGRLRARDAAAPYDLPYLPSARAARWLSLGHPTVLANLYWLRAVQYMGDPRADARGWDRLFPVLDLITDLDPRHGYAYQVGGNILAGVDRVDESNRLLEKGVLNLPERYILPFHRGVNAFVYSGDYAAAGEWFERAARTPGAPPHMREAVMALYVKGDRVDAAIRFLTHMLEQAEGGESRKALEAQLQQAYFERAALVIDAAAERYRERFARLPTAVWELTAAGLLPEAPPDPYGGSWVLDAEGRAHSTAHERRVMRPQTALERGRVIERLHARLKENQAQ